MRGTSSIFLSFVVEKHYEENDSIFLQFKDLLVPRRKPSIFGLLYLHGTACRWSDDEQIRLALFTLSCICSRSERLNAYQAILDFYAHGVGSLREIDRPLSAHFSHAIIFCGVRQE